MAKLPLLRGSLASFFFNAQSQDLRKQSQTDFQHPWGRWSRGSFSRPTGSGGGPERTDWSRAILHVRGGCKVAARGPLVCEALSWVGFVPHTVGVLVSPVPPLACVGLLLSSRAFLIIMFATSGARSCSV